jgi:hypothetical protein
LPLWGRLGFGLDRRGRREPLVRLRRGHHAGYRARVQGERYVLVLLKQGEVGIRAFDLFDKGGANGLGLGARVSLFPGAEAHERKLVIFAALEAQRPAVGTIR